MNRIGRGARAAAVVVTGALMLASCGASSGEDAKSSGGATTTLAGSGGSGNSTTTDAPKAVERSIMPDVIGKTEDEARADLTDRGVDDDDILVDERESLERAGTIIDQVPSSGSDITGSVNLVVAKPVGPVPDFVGKQISEAESWAEERGIKVRQSTVLDDALAEGEIIATTPKAGQEASSEIAVQVASKPVVGALDDLQPTATSSCSNIDSGEASVNGESIQESLVLQPYRNQGSDPCVVEYDFGRDWSRLKATVGILDASPTDSRTRLQVFGDGKELLNQVISFASTNDLDLDVSNVLRLRIQVTYVSGSPGDVGVHLVLGNLRRIGSPAEVPETTTTVP